MRRLWLRFGRGGWFGIVWWPWFWYGLEVLFNAGHRLGGYAKTAESDNADKSRGLRTASTLKITGSMSTKIERLPAFLSLLERIFPCE